MIRKSVWRFSLATNANAFARRSCANNKLKRDGDSTKAIALQASRDRRGLWPRTHSRKPAISRSTCPRPSAAPFGSRKRSHLDRVGEFERGEGLARPLERQGQLARARIPCRRRRSGRKGGS